ncbi:MAG: TonB-dependent receptor, partial [Gemmatimonadetes bacterium]|nr:TonB-dependent receptor [Gemmatimonadota bacterium]
MNRTWVRGVLLGLALAHSATDLWAQGTAGKIEGTVLDQAGQPVNGAQVLVLGTSYGTVTDTKGYYFINNVPAGVYDLRAQFIGLQPAEVRTVRVLGGQTMTVRFSLTAAVQIGGISVVVEATPLVPRDQVTSKPIVTGQVVDQLPVDDIRQVLRLQPGVVESGRAAGLSIRGGRAGEAAIYVDGVLVRSVRTGGSRLDVGTNAVEEASITTGALDAEFGDAQSGVISYVTRAGGSRYQGSLSLQSDEPFGDKVSVGYNRAEFSVGGPIFGNLTFFLAGTADGQQSDFLGLGADTVPSYVLGGVDTTVTVATGTDPRVDSLRVDIPQFVQFSGACDPANNYDFECQGRRRPMNWSTSYTTNAKLQYTYGSGSRVSLSGLVDQEQSRDFTGSVFHPIASTGTRSTSSAYIVNWVQQVLRGTDRALAFDVNLSYQTDRNLGGALERDYEITNRDAAFGLAFAPMKFLIDFDHFSEETGTGAVTSLNSQAEWDQLIQNIRTNTGTRVPFLDRGDLRFAQPYRMNPWAVGTGFPTVGLERTATLGQERRLYGRVNVDWQFDRYNRFKFGGEYQKSRVNFFNSSILRQTFMNAYAEAPVRYGAYGEDRIDLGDVVIVLGVRWDSYDAGSLFPIVPGRTFTHPSFSASDPINSNIWKPAETHTAVSPRVQVSFPVTERTGFRLSYSHQVQTPDFGSMLRGSNNDLSFTNPNEEFGGDVDFGKTILFEFGIRHAFGPDMVLDLSAYNKDKVSDLAYRIQPFFDPLQKRLQSLQVLTNADFGNVRGVDVNLIRRISNIFTSSVSYTYQIARGTGSDPFSYINTLARELVQVTGDRAPPAQALLPTDDNRTHNVAGSLSANFPRDFSPGTVWGSILQNAGVFATFRFASGLPYTRLRNSGNGQTAPILDCGLGCERAEPINSSTMPWIKSFDLRVNKGLRLGRLDVTLFGDFRNLLNFRNVVELFAETGDVANKTYRDKEFVSPETQRLRNDALASGRLVQVT